MTTTYHSHTHTTFILGNVGEVSSPHCQVTYVWINQDGTNPKAKTRILDSEPQNVPQWYSTYYLDCVYEMTLIPVQMFRDPFLLDPHKLVLCDTRQLNGAPARKTNCAEAMEAVKDQKPWFGFEQEYLLKALDGLPFGWHSVSRSFIRLSTVHPFVLTSTTILFGSFSFGIVICLKVTIGGSFGLDAVQLSTQMKCICSWPGVFNVTANSPFLLTFLV
uniref:Uncharacterized protein n=1 Tax=Periophthalmus magnuspinnatus TaxID=409849 RepID=A0A3B4A3A0_9GOBI